MTPENVTGPVAVHAEAPVWWPGWGGLRWVDGDAGDLLTLRGDDIVRQHVDDEYLAFFRPRTSGASWRWARVPCTSPTAPTRRPVPSRPCSTTARCA